MLLSLRLRGRVCFRGELLVWGHGVRGSGEQDPFTQPLLMSQRPLNPVLGMVPPSIKTKAALWVLSADRSPGSDEMHDPVPTHMPSEESNYILETVAGTRNKASRRLRGVREFVPVSEMSKYHL